MMTIESMAETLFSADLSMKTIYDKVESLY